MSELYQLFRDKDKKAITALIFLIFLGIVLEIFSLSIINPVVSLILNETTSFSVFEGFFLVEGVERKEALLFMIFIFLVKFLFFGILSYFQNKTLTDFTEYISSSLFNKYLEIEYLDRIKKTSGDIVNIIQNEVNRLYSYLYDSLILIIESIFSISIFITLFIYSPLITSYVIVFVLLFGLFYKFIFGKRLKYYGEKRQELEFDTTNKIVDAVALFKEIRVFNKVPFFEKKYKEVNIKRYAMHARYMTLNQFSRYIVELIFIFLLVSSLGYSLYLEIDIKSTIPTVSLFLAAALRILPSLNRIISSYQTRKYYQSSLNVISENLNERIPNKSILFSDPTGQFKRIIEFRNINYGYNNKKLFEDFSFSIKKSEILGVKGPSGIGKSTLFEVLMGLISPKNIEIRIDDNVINKTQLLFNIFSFVPQKVHLLNTNIYENICFGQNLCEEKKKEIDYQLSTIGLGDFIDDFEKKLGEGGQEVSGGQKQKIATLRAINSGARIILMDETFSNLDNKSKDELFSLLNNLKGSYTFVISSHEDYVLKKTDRIIAL